MKKQTEASFQFVININSWAPPLIILKLHIAYYHKKYGVNTIYTEDTDLGGGRYTYTRV